MPSKNNGIINIDYIVSELETFGFTCKTPYCRSKIVDICEKHNKDEEEFSDALVGFMQTAGNTDVSSEILDKLDIQMGKKSKAVKNVVIKQEIIHEPMEFETDEQEEKMVMGCYASPHTVGQSKKVLGEALQTPKSTITDSLRKKLNSCVSLSPSSTATPSQKYAERQNPLMVLATYGSIDKISATEDSKKPELKVTCMSQNPLTRDNKFMHQKLWEIATVLSDHIDSLAEFIREANKEEIDSFENVLNTSSETFHICGIICCDSVGKLNGQSVLLQGSQSTSLGCAIPLDLSGLSDYCLFPGQIAAFAGSNPTGRQFVATKCFPAVAPAPMTIKPDSNRNSMTIVVAAGPFTTSDSLSYEPLSDLITFVIENEPDCLILMGPFLDKKHHQVETAQMDGFTFQQYFEALLNNIRGAVRSKTQILYIPSVRDVVQTGVYPSFPYYLENFICPKSFMFLTDPCLVEMGGVIVGATTVDPVMHLSAEAIFQSSGSVDRFQTLVGQLITQQSFYPLNPPVEDISIDFRLFHQHAGLPIRPHILIVPSHLRYFVKNVNGVICINPGTLAKGLIGGSFGRVTVDFTKMKAEECSLESCVKAEIVKI